VADVEISWGDGFTGGSIYVTHNGVTVHADHCGCHTNPLEDPVKIRELFLALVDWIGEHPLED
jgi:hypothetical protein